tara:strand:+ start:783 stop:1016 length:234 start_codon:yes stop_codon:yes gene_type:complete
MDERLTHIEKEYELLKEKYPNLVKMNTKILNFYKEKMNYILEECEKSIENIKKTNRDVTNRELQFIYLYRYIDELSI